MIMMMMMVTRGLCEEADLIESKHLLNYNCATASSHFRYVPLDGPTVYTFQGSNNAADSKSWEDLVVVTSSAPWAENEMRTHHVHKPR